METNLQHNVPCGNGNCSICMISTNGNYVGTPSWLYWPYQQICPSCGRCPTCGQSKQYNQWTITSGGTQIQ